MKQVDWKRKYEAELVKRQKEKERRMLAESKYEAEHAERLKERSRRIRAERERAATQVKLEGARRDARRLFKKVQELERHLKMYENPHTPPSRRAPAQKNGKKGKGKKAPSGKKQGGQKGHPGKTNKPKPTRFEEHTMSECPHCGSNHIYSNQQKKRNITEIELPPPPVTTCHTINIYDCAACGKKEMEPETGLPSEGDLGKCAVSEIVGNFADRMPHRKNAERMAHAGLSVAASTTNNVLRRVGFKLEGSVAAILAILACAHVLHVDETSYRVNGKTVWVWIFLDPATGCALYVMRKSRGRDVLKEILPEFRGTIVCDGWWPYRTYAIQRCWAHIMREARYLAEAHPRSRAAQDILKRLQRVYEIGCDARGRRMSRARRVRLRAALLGHVTRILNDYHGNKTAEKFLTKLEGAADDLFEFVLDPRVDPTNNAAERGLREIVIHRKIRNTLRAFDSMIPFGNIFTCVVTWKNQGLDYRTELQKYV